jgi:hypothetical protein
MEKEYLGLKSVWEDNGKTLILRPAPILVKEATLKTGYVSGGI